MQRFRSLLRRLPLVEQIRPRDFWFGLAAMFLTATVMTGFLLESRWGYPAPEPKIIYVENWKADRPRAEAEARQAQERAERARLMAELRAAEARAEVERRAGAARAAAADR